MKPPIETLSEMKLVGKRLRMSFVDYKVGELWNEFMLRRNEVSIYIAAEHRGKGVGKALFAEPIKQSEENGLWTLQSGIFPENIDSIKMHKDCGFREIGFREKVGNVNGV
jgi:GNAT superfamily N-acetyltransferase